jgi:hypothetical protein
LVLALPPIHALSSPFPSFPSLFSCAQGSHGPLWDSHNRGMPEPLIDRGVIWSKPQTSLAKVLSLWLESKGGNQKRPHLHSAQLCWSQVYQRSQSIATDIWSWGLRAAVKENPYLLACGF